MHLHTNKWETFMCFCCVWWRGGGSSQNGIVAASRNSPFPIEERVPYTTNTLRYNLILYVYQQTNVSVPSELATMLINLIGSRLMTNG